MRTILFFSDVNNTVTTSPVLSNEDYVRQIGDLVNKLAEVSDKYNAEQILVSFSTSFRKQKYENIEKIIGLFCEQAKLKHIPLRFSKVFMNDAVFECGDNYQDYELAEPVVAERVIQLGNHIKELGEKGYEIIWVGYADDSYPTNEKIGEKLKLMGIDISYNGFVPTVWGINVADENAYVSTKPSIIGLNETLDSFILESKVFRK